MTLPMNSNIRPALLGLVIAIAFIAGTLLFGYAIENYSFVSQTLSEIGSMSSPMRLPFQIFKVVIAVLILLFAALVIKFARKKKLSVVPGIFLLCFGLSDLGLALFPTPHDLHNVFGLSLTLGYLLPLFFALLWSGEEYRSFKRASLVFFLLILVGIVFNLSPAFKPDLYPLQYYGLVQRFLVYTMFVYLAYLGLSIRNHS